MFWLRNKKNNFQLRTLMEGLDSSFGYPQPRFWMGNKKEPSY